MYAISQRSALIIKKVLVFPKPLVIDQFSQPFSKETIQRINTRFQSTEQPVWLGQCLIQAWRFHKNILNSFSLSSLSFSSLLIRWKACHGSLRNCPSSSIQCFCDDCRKPIEKYSSLEVYIDRYLQVDTDVAEFHHWTRFLASSFIP